ncbi:DUF1702 family protein [Actinoplanes teichomyceticus]|uniref:Uncharacterized protein DUF1702 n=1 Tax=Actinoplanes teichomyceticus TaxID=1867 RepID=A0A561WBW3_ACTTI|nr:DUF1702 family protein [Actinoplanes teichomyceticus]TWG21335.1 uncharacterized protein DUF1702 [Actinoplanes teichomyceticus]GIF16420.1 hypothetical protein Ate01nite_64520 [Actinoplanes teichomyceticus]
MAHVLGAVRRLMLAPPLEEVTFARRGFSVTASAHTRALEAIPQAVICGFEWGMDTRTQWQLQRRLDLVDAEHRGFAYEGATMALTILDAMAAGRGHRARDLLAGPGRPHTFLTYIGVGFAMARLPRPLWRKVLPDLSGVPYYPTMSWLAVDGYGFDRAYFRTDRWVAEQERPRPYPWLGDRDYFARAFDQGVGRALWFVHGGDAIGLAATIGGFAHARRADLWSGAGLAATFAGGTDRAGYAMLRSLASSYRGDVAQGAVFAARARTHAGFVPEHTETAIHILAGLSAAGATDLADASAVPESASGTLPAYEQWRRRIRAAVPGLDRV